MQPLAAPSVGIFPIMLTLLEDHVVSALGAWGLSRPQTWFSGCHGMHKKVRLKN